MGYADFQSALAQLSLDEGDDDDAADIALLHACDDAVSVLFEQKAGYDATQTPIWGADVTATATAKTIDGDRNDSAILLLPVPARSIASVQVIGERAETLTTADWITWDVSNAGDVRAVRRIDGYAWPYRDGLTRMTVTAIWADGPVGGDPPAIVTEACTFLAVDEFRMRKMSPAGEIGPDGMTIRPRNPWGYELVKTALDAVRVPMPVVVF